MRSTRGSVLLTTLFIITATALVAYAVYDLALTTYRLSQRNEYLARAKAVAESELEYVYFRVWQTVSEGATFDQVPGNLIDACDVFHQNAAEAAVPGNIVTPTTERVPFVASLRTTPEAWKVRRSISYQSSGVGTQNRVTGVFYYYAVKVEVYSTSSPVGQVLVRLGRSMSVQKSSIFQFNIFSQGDLEFAPAGNTVIRGDVAANGRIYMGVRLKSDGTVQTHLGPDGTTQVPDTLTLDAYVSFIAQPEDVSSPWSNSIFLNKLVDGTTTTTLSAPTFGSASDQSVAFTNQVAPMSEPVNLLGGLNAKEIALQYGTLSAGSTNYGLFGAITSSDTDINADQVNSAENLVYHSMIAPPPSAEYLAATNLHGNGTSYLADYPDAGSVPSALQNMPDDPGVGALRAYNRAGLVITVNADGLGTTFQVRDNNGVLQDSFTPATADNPLTPATMYDLREAKYVAITDVDVAKLASLISTKAPSFNGLLYVYVAGTPSSDGTNPDLPAVRLNNGATTPGATALTGFSVATNGGLYVRGDYNTTTVDGAAIATDGSNLNPAMLMADAVTILSSNWKDAAVTPTGAADPWAAYKKDANATVIPYSSIADGSVNTSDTLLQLADGSVNPDFVAFQSSLPTTVANPTGLRLAPASVNPTTIGAGILTGSITQATDGSGYLTDTSVYSGGGQNLVRFLEDWGTNGSTVNFYGSIGRLFQSTHFTTPYKLPATNTYRNPVNRLFSFNSSLRSKPPPKSPDDTKVDRGTLFTWTPQ